MDFRSRLYSECWILSPGQEKVSLDLTRFFLHLLLFDHYIMRSNRLREVPELVGYFGDGPTRRLLDSPWFQLELAPAGLGIIGDRHLRRVSSSLDIFGPFNYTRFMAADPGAIVRSGMQGIDEALGRRSRRSKIFTQAVANRLVPPRADPHAQSLAQTRHDLATNTALVSRSVANAASRVLGRQVEPQTFRLETEETASGFDVHSDIASALSITEAEALRVIDEGILGIGGLNQRVELMTAHNALVGARRDELSVYEGKLERVLSHLDPSHQIQRFTRVLSALELPSITPETVQQVDLDRVLDIRDTDEAKAFRAWLWGVDSVTDDELAARFGSLRNRLGLAIRTTAGRVQRFAVSVVTGLVPGAGTILSAGLGALDTFLLERVTAVPAPFVFLGNQYKSIFERGTR